MRHATSDDLVAIAPLLAELRTVGGLVERTPGTFYRRSRAFLHFHADEAGMYADIRLEGDEFERVPVNSSAAQQALMRQVRLALGEEATPV
jgi:N-acetylglutamate synthase-like GNAT family acetyltransferase